MGHVYAVSDLHGMIELYKQIKDFLKPDDIVYFLGDMGDRGTDCWETVKAILDDSQFKVIMGNHEDMLIKVMTAYYHFPVEERDSVLYSHDAQILSWNGGIPTYTGWTKEDEGTRLRYYRRLKALPTHLEYVNKDGIKVFMSHAGFTPYGDDDFPIDEDLIWDRSHFMYGWPHEALENAISIHGHTPIEYLVDDLHRFSRGPYELPTLPVAYWYADHHKCCIDNGAFYTNCTVLLDLDTFEEHKFYTKDYDPEAIYD